MPGNVSTIQAMTVNLFITYKRALLGGVKIIRSESCMSSYIKGIENIMP